MHGLYRLKVKYFFSAAMRLDKVLVKEGKNVKRSSRVFGILRTYVIGDSIYARFVTEGFFCRTRETSRFLRDFKGIKKRLRERTDKLEKEPFSGSKTSDRAMPEAIEGKAAKKKEKSVFSNLVSIREQDVTSFTRNV